MSKDIRIFIASPGGLEAERKAFHDAIEEYNIAEAKHRSIHFYPEGWEIVLGGVGRPQATINKLVRKCDYLLLVLHDKMGSPTGNPKYLSGSHEEYCVALRCCRYKRYLMKNVIVLFKGLPPERLADQGPQLKKVIKFKKELQKNKKIYYKDFDDIKSFEKILRQHLGDWRRGHEVKPEKKTVITEKDGLRSQPPDLVSFSPKEMELIEKAEKYANEGKLLEAEEHFARGIVTGNNPAAFNQYGHFLKRVGRFSQAFVMFKRVFELASMSGDIGLQAIACGNMGIIYQIFGDLKGAEKLHRLSLNIEKERGGYEGMADQYGNLGIIYQQRGNLQQAEKMFLKSLKIDKKFGRLEGIANNYSNLGNHYQLQSNLEKAEKMHRKSLEIEETLGNQEGIATDYANLGLVYKFKGDSKNARAYWLKALELFKKIGMPHMIEKVQEFLDGLEAEESR